MNTTRKTISGRIMAAVMAVAMIAILLCAVPTGASAAQANQQVMDAKNGVFQIQVWFVDPLTLNEYGLHSGTGFLINDNTVVTCDHVASGFLPYFYEGWAKNVNAELGTHLTAEDIKDNLEIRIIVYRDVYIKAKVRKASSEMDYAILELEESIQNRTPLAIRKSSSLQQTEDVFALGFPGDITEITSASTYSAEDVTITSGSVDKVANMTYDVTKTDPYDGQAYVVTHTNLNIIEHSAK